MTPVVLEVVSRYPDAAFPRGSITSLGSNGGLSGSRFWRYQSRIGELLLHAWPEGGPTPGRLCVIHDWMARLRSLSFIPRLIPDLAGRTFEHRQGRLWELMTWRPGAMDPSPCAARIIAAFQCLAQVHQALGPPLGIAPSPSLRRRCEDLEGLRRGLLDILATRLAPAHPATAAAHRHLTLARNRLEDVRRLLVDAAKLAVPLQPCLRDLRPDHVLFLDDQVAGVVDFGAMDRETIAGDLARLLAGWRLIESATLRSTALKAYSASRRIEQDEQALLRAFEFSGALLGGCQWVDWISRQGFDAPLNVAISRLEHATLVLSSMP